MGSLSDSPYTTHIDFSDVSKNIKLMMNLHDIELSELSQTQSDKHSTISLTCEI